MRIAILSDIHDNVWALDAALNGLRQLSAAEAGGPIEAMIFCGDLCAPFIIHLLAKGFPAPIHIVLGNNDGDRRNIALNAGKYANAQVHGEFFEGELGGKRFAVNHYPEIARAVAAAGRHDVVCYGHNHLFQVETEGRTLTINPGAILGYNPAAAQDIPSTFVVYDTLRHLATGYQAQLPHRETSAAQLLRYP